MKKMIKGWQRMVFILAVFILFGAFNEAQAASGANGTVRAAATQSDGKIIICGDFTSYDGVAKNHIARLNADGTLDGNFSPNLSAVDSVMAVAIQSDGKVLIGGIMNTVPSGNNRSIYRLNIDGTVDTSFASGVYINGSIRAIVVQSDGKIIIGGYFSTFNGVTRESVARLSSDGTLDDSFVPDTGTNGTIRAIAVQSDGKIIISGGFPLNNAPYWRNIARLNSDGRLDPAFSHGGLSVGSSSVNAIAIQPDGKIVIGGYFQIFLSNSGVFINNIARLGADGALDLSFSLNAGNVSAWMGFVGANTTGYVNTISIGSDGKIVIVGSFGHLNILNADGKLNHDSGEWNGQILAMAQSDSGIVVGGEFTSYNGSPSNHASLLSSDGLFIDACSVLDLDASFNNYDFPIKENLVVITHGWNGDAINADSFPKKMQEEICKNIDRSNTTVAVYDWHNKAGGTPLDAYNNASERVNEPSSLSIINYVPAQGTILYDKIRLFNNKPKNIHFIAHSAGSKLIQTATDLLVHHYRDTGVASSEAPSVHLTFLDAFAPWGEENNYGDLSGGIDDGYKLVGYADHYVDNRPVNFTNGILDYTHLRLVNATNFDITYLDKDNNSVHEWPYEFYIESVINSEYTLPITGDKNMFRLGFPFSLESNTYINGSDDSVRSHKDDWCIVTNVSEPYRRCFDEKEIEERDVILTDPDQSVPTITGSGTLIDVSQFIGPMGENNNEWGGRLPEITMAASGAIVEIPMHTTVTSDVSGWNGIFSAPSARVIPSADAFTIDDKTIGEIGKYASRFDAIDLGIFDQGMHFDQAVKVTFPGTSDMKNVAYSNFGNNYFTIPDCKNRQLFGQDLNGGACKMRNSNGDFVVWTMHFTTFMVYIAADITLPITTLSTSGTQGSNGWFTSNVQVTLDSKDEDGGSGIDKTEYSLDNGVNWVAYINPFAIFNEGINKVEFRSTDRAGNIENAQSAEIRIDKTVPKITVDTPADEAQYVLKLTTNAGWSATDEGSGIDTSTGTVVSGGAIDTSSVGSREFTVTATDKAGNSVTKTVNYSVVYAFGGFQNPTIKDKAFNSNSTIPVSFQLTDTNGKYITNAIASLEVDEKPAVASGNSNTGNSFRYDASANQYIFNLSAKNSSIGSGAPSLTIKLDDGTTYSQAIAIK